MMGAGIAYSCARSGMHVLLKDVSLEAAEREYGVRIRFSGPPDALVRTPEMYEIVD
jgi:hypothetical protein